MNSRLYKILTTREIKDFARDKVFRGNDLDRHHGYIHLLSNSQQYSHVIDKYYKHLREVYILEIDATKLTDVRYKGKYPHFYGKLQWYHIMYWYYIRNTSIMNDGIITSFEE